MVEQGGDVLDNYKSDGGVTTKQRVDSCQHCAADDWAGEVVALEVERALVKVITGLTDVRGQ